MSWVSSSAIESSLFHFADDFPILQFFSVTDAVDCDGTINGIDPMSIVTLSGEQFIPGSTTFRHLEVTEALEVSLFSPRF